MMVLKSTHTRFICALFALVVACQVDVIEAGQGPAASHVMSFRKAFTIGLAYMAESYFVKDRLKLEQPQDFKQAYANEIEDIALQITRGLKGLGNPSGVSWEQEHAIVDPLRDKKKKEYHTREKIEADDSGNYNLVTCGAYKRYVTEFFWLRSNPDSRYVHDYLPEIMEFCMSQPSGKQMLALDKPGNNPLWALDTSVETLDKRAFNELSEQALENAGLIIPAERRPVAVRGRPRTRIGTCDLQFEGGTDQPAMPKPRWQTKEWHVCSHEPKQDWWKNGKWGLINPRNTFVKDLIDIPEQTFRQKVAWPSINPFRPYDSWVKAYRNSKSDDYRRAAILQGTFELKTVNQLTNELGRVRGSDNGSLYMMVWDPYYPWESDIRYLQALPSNKGNVFQLASTFFGPLEGGIASAPSMLKNMFPSAAQGEEASIATAGAAFWRKYVMGFPYYLLYKFGDRLPMYDAQVDKAGHFYYLDRKSNRKQVWGDIRKGKIKKPAIDRKKLAVYTYSLGNEGLVGLGIHRNIVVTSGYGMHEFALGKERGQGAQQRLKVWTQQSEGQTIVDADKSQLITQVLCSALSLRGLDPAATQDAMRSAAQMILRADYEGTVKAAAYVGQNNPAAKRVWLTLMGASAFANDIRWLADAMNRPDFINTIKNFGLKAILLYRPDNKPHRTADADVAFFTTMLGVMDAVNGTSLAGNTDLITTIKKYVQAAIGLIKGDGDKGKVHEYAVYINSCLMPPHNCQRPTEVARSSGLAALGKPARGGAQRYGQA